MSDALRELIAIPRDYYKPGEVAKVLGCDPQKIRIMAKQHPEKLGFRVIVIGSRVKIVRASFLRYMGVEEPDTETIIALPKQWNQAQL
ncbi:MAG: hypothetical protein KH050_08125 [Clostridiaceae bacterium]|nr:hypothetical protein [Clostridiaceae bacterium]